MLHNLGAFLSAKQVEGLVNWSSSSRRINYRKWSISHKPVFDGNFYTCMGACSCSDAKVEKERSQHAHSP
jgi:hypothetical protein